LQSYQMPNRDNKGKSNPKKNRLSINRYYKDKKEFVQ
jgi:hypothetical protein